VTRFAPSHTADAPGHSPVTVIRGGVQCDDGTLLRDDHFYYLPIEFAEMSEEQQVETFGSLRWVPGINSGAIPFLESHTRNPLTMEAHR